ncbi:riboflavin biosynthesis protein RibF [Bacillus sp. FJAT-18017]|uniref:bifunctional riboflavin kinase/FAD synthetase n=1 Tax=Bacillus sp. FJAT-18017 TaxID=1705566 RepID=UPI0006AF7E17|nr:bifunctional riboflavin kinase/FAD synthetase [Bacillus sp. FJAT-18017]ALC90973.1 riboflavin biosynthesis protein RibF [Bacillus sp. FJAT-18017]
MEVINLKYPHHIAKNDLPPSSVALGYFDGVHLGHQKVISDARLHAEEKGLKTAVMTFHPHPKVVLGRMDQEIEYITPMDEKIRLIAETGADILFIAEFSNEFANLTPQEFIDQYIIGLNIQHVSAGFDYSYGRMGKGNMETMPFHSRGQFSYSMVEKLELNGEKISSTLIRQYIMQGKMEAIKGLLGRMYTTSGVVIHGDKRGRTIGFPTANVGLTGEYLLPPLGVYAVRIHVGGSWYYGVCNMGYKPTFKKEKAPKPSIEVNIFDFNEDIYGQRVIVEWHVYLRKEQKFTGINELVSQINKDKERTAVHFGLSIG